MKPATRGALSSFIALSLGFAVVATPSARADLINGVCTLDMTFTFTAPPTVGGTSPGYAIDINQANSSCTLDSLDQTPSVSVGGSSDAGDGGTSLANCGVLAGIGSWNQRFGGVVPPVVNGTHAVAGTWLNATMIVSAYPNDNLARFNGVIELTPYPTEPLANAYKTDSCVSGEDVTSIRMLGVEVFNDPTVP